MPSRAPPSLADSRTKSHPREAQRNMLMGDGGSASRQVAEAALNQHLTSELN